MVAIVILLTMHAQSGYCVKEIQQLKWLTGSWKGMNGDKPFYEAWRLVNDSVLINLEIEIKNGDTIIKESNGLLLIEQGIYLGQKPTQWKATRITPNEIVLKNDSLPYSNTIIWLHTKDDHWFAILEHPKSTIYYDLIRQPAIDRKVEEWIGKMRGSGVGSR